MIKLYDHNTGEHIGYAIKYDRKNKIEYNMFGVTGTAEGRQTKIDCQGVAYVKNGFAFEEVKKDNYVVLHGGKYKQMDVYTLLELYDTNQERG